MGTKPDKVKDRAFELDVLRGIAILWVVFMHFSFDIRYIVRLKAFSYLASNWYWVFGETLTLITFVGLSGVCCTFSKNNLKRGIKLLVVALTVTLVTFIVTKYFGIDCLIIFNVLHTLSVGILLYFVLALIEKKTKMNPKVMSLLMAFFGLWAVEIGNQIARYNGVFKTNLLIPFGILNEDSPYMGDYMPLFPWIGVFLIGAVVGRTIYSDRKTLFPNAPSAVRKITKPFAFMGRHSLIIYLVHQPVVLGITYLVVWIMGRK
ncbi:MAG: DUF1624 domain-containing protein [Clostridiales bacterium]|nr:DUF1624 domain-containing protein [Clostridiales bacterium]